MKKTALFLVYLGMIFTISAGTAMAASTSYFLYGDGTSSYDYYDAEKQDYNNNSNDDDDLMCWAATVSNMLAWSGWGNTVSSSEDAIFSYFQTYWTDAGGNIEFGLDWWFYGENLYQGESYANANWSQLEEINGTTGGDFYTREDLQVSYKNSYSDSTALATIYSYLSTGYVVGLSIKNESNRGHAVTCWGVQMDDSTGDYLGVYLTDSDNNKNLENAADTLNYYKILLSDGKWYLQNFYSQNGYYITEVHGLSAMAAVPLPGAVLLLTSGLTALAGICRRRPETT